MPRSKTGSQNSAAIAPQQQAAAMAAVRRMLSQKEQARATLVRFLSMLLCWFGTKPLFGQLSASFAEQSAFHDVLISVNLAALRASPEALDELVAKKPESLNMAVTVIHTSGLWFPEWASRGQEGFECLEALIKNFYSKPRRVQSTGQKFLECGFALKSQDLMICLAHQKLAYSGESIANRLVYDSAFLKLFHELSNLSGQIPNAGTTHRVAQINSMICRRFTTVRFFELSFAATMGLGLPIYIATMMMGVVLHLIGPLIVRSVIGKMAIQMPDPADPTKTIMIISPQQLKEMDQCWAERMHEICLDLERESIPYTRYIERAMIVSIPLIFLMFAYSWEWGILNYKNMFAFMLPLFPDLIDKVIRYLHYLAFRRGRFESCTQSALGWLQTALLIKTGEYSLNDVLHIARVELVQELHHTQFAISSNPRQRVLSGNNLLFILAELFDEYSLEYIAVEGKNRKLSIVYINTMDVYNILGASGYRFWQGKACYQFAKQLELACKKYTCQQYLTKKILIRLKKQRKIAGFWLNEATKQVLQYDVKMPSAISLENYFDLDKGVSGVEFGSDAGLAFIRLDMRVASLSDIGKIGLNNEGAGEKMPMQAHVVYGTDEAAPAPQARRRINPARVAVPAAVPATPQLQIEKWTIGSVVYSSDMEHVHMILGTEKHKNPIYVAHAMKEEDFGDSLIYLSFCRQIERARFASPKTDQGMFVTENQQKLTIKLLGANTGDVRCTARGFYTSKNGSHLYVVDTYGTHADQ